MWEQYRRTLIPTQFFIIVLSIAMYAWGHATGGAVAAIFIAMEIGAFVGAWWAARLKSKIIASRNRLPLEK